MGSRSYFHYADVLAVLSRGRYVGIDPLMTVTTWDRRNGGWMLPKVGVLDRATASEADLAVADEAGQLFALADVCSATPLKEEARGAAFLEAGQSRDCVAA